MKITDQDKIIDEKLKKLSIDLNSELDKIDNSKLIDWSCRISEREISQMSIFEKSFLYLRGMIEKPKMVFVITAVLIISVFTNSPIYYILNSSLQNQEDVSVQLSNMDNIDFEQDEEIFIDFQESDLLFYHVIEDPISISMDESLIVDFEEL